ncbi:PAS domain S-box protein [Chitinimonas arctica]|uniref:histidine kinase n=1 Tax=Chitinimonas arctica TaxID=2594795 RepID=A0A516SKX8_9NEIS|nr:ATP-binding protein [Chitinimonas arctica]QDQ28773.1 PAS domain S-box protein [Chitinimonas arctica]
MFPRSPSFSAAGGRQLWLLPRLALVLFVAAVIGLLAYVRMSEREEARLVLVSDVLWMEQNLRFQFEQTEERLAAMLESARDGGLGEADFRARARLIAQANPALVGLHISGAVEPLDYGQVLESSQIADMVRLSRATGRPAYTDVLGNNLLAVAISDQGRDLVALMALPKILNQQVPWWFANKYRLTVLDGQGRQIASKSGVSTDDEALSYQLPFDPPGRGMILRITAYRTPTGTVQKGLIAGVVVLAVMVLLSWLRLNRQVQGRLNAEAALREEYAFRTAMEDSLSVGMRARDLDGRIIYVNAAFCRMVGYSATELMGSMPPYPYWNPADIAGHQAQNEAVLAGRAPQGGFESTVRHRNGQLVATRVYTTPLIDATGRQRGWMSSVVDITSQKAAEAREHEQEEKLRQTGRLIAMGEMASTLAHELNQPLMAMSSYASAARNFAGRGEQDMLDSTLNKIAEQAQRAAGVVRRIREFVRKHAPHREECDLNEIARDTLELIDPDARARGVRLVCELAPDMPIIAADRVLLGQVMVNLLRNAIDACAEQAADRREVVFSTGCTADQVGFSVADRGHGIPAEIVERLYEAFFTTKTLGMGIGLNICRSIIEQHHGKLHHHARPDGGTQFHVSLPR